MNIKELVLKTRSYRAFDENERIGRERLVSYVDAARLTASTANLQALCYRVVFTVEECEKAFSATKWAGYIKNERIPPEFKKPTGYIIICVNKDITNNIPLFYKDTGIAAQTIMMSATEEGFGGCMIGSFDEELLRRELDLPENMEVTLVLALGRPAETVRLCENTGDIKYYRENGVHYVPKRSLDEVLIQKAVNR